MGATKLIALLLILGGVLGLVYGGFNYTKETHTADIGALHLAVAEKQHVNVPLWVGIGGIFAGVVLLATSRKS